MVCSMSYGCYIVLDIIVMSGEVFCCSEVCDTLVGVLVFNINIWSEF